MRGLLLVLFLLLLGAPALASVETECEAERFRNVYFLDGNVRKFDEEKRTALVYKLDTKVYKASRGDDVLAGRALAFSERVRISDPGEGTGRLQIKELGGRPIGWVDRGDVLCRELPLIDSQTKLFRRSVVRTEQAERGHVQPKKAFHNPDGRCQGACLEVTRMRWYFVYGEINGHLLISDFAQLANRDTRLFGWLPVGDSIPWNTSLGLRPTEQLANERGPAGEVENFICAYKDRSESGGCNQVLGGRRWFTKETRMLILREDTAGYDVAFTSASVADRDYTRLVETVKNLDVFFIIDGTDSMQPAIDHVKETVQQVVKALRHKTQQGAGLRFGYRIYRDSAAGRPALDGVANSEKLLFDPTNCTVANDQEFLRSFEAVRARNEPADDPDYSENVFGGIIQAAQDMAACPENVKLVFVIGDHGYDAEAQGRRGHSRWTEADVATRFAKAGNVQGRHNARFANPPLVYFLQTPAKCEGPKCKPDDYTKAYDKFTNQAKDILKKIYAGRPERMFSDTDKFSLKLSADNEVVDTISAGVTEYLRPGNIVELAQRLAAGQPLVQAIEQMHQASPLDVPISWALYVEAALCARLGDQCRTAVIQSVNEAFIPKRYDTARQIEHELLISAEQLMTWIKVLERFKQFFTAGGVSTQERRESMVNALLAGLSGLFQVPIGSDQVSLAQRATFHANVPNAALSPLLRYSANDLMNSATTPTCELEYLGGYASKRHDILFNIQDGTILVEFNAVPVPQGTCPSMSEKGRRVPFFEGQILPRRIARAGEEADYKLVHTRSGERWFWIPVRYMP